MANNCSTTYKLVGDKAECNRFMQMIRDVQNHPVYKETCHYWGDPWMGDILRFLGYTEEEIEKCPHFRGGIQYIEFDDSDNFGLITMQTESAWTECDGWRDYVSKKFNLKWYFASEEPGCCYFVTNDVDGVCFTCKYHIEVFSNDDAYSEDYDTLEELLDEVQRVTGIRPDNFEHAEEVCREFTHQHDDDYIYVYEYSIVD